jgi:glycosyltransferase involved in cell wall biosynthesis
MRLFFVYVSDGGAPVGSNTSWDINKKTNNVFANKLLKEEGYFYLVKEMEKQGIVDELTIVIESNRSPGSIKIDGYNVVVTPEIANIKQWLEPGDVVWFRGGFRSYFPLIQEFEKERVWTIIYSANTGRQRWKEWDVIFDDLNPTFRFDIHNRFYFPFRKPINPFVFYHIKPMDKIYDVCVGASHIHDKKGQYKMINAAIEYQKLYNEKLRCVLPGRIMKGVYTSKIKSLISKHDLKADMPGMIPRKELNVFYNRSILYAAMGEGGQNDRGPLEALCAGTPILLSNPARHHPDANHYFETDYNNDPKALAQQIRRILNIPHIDECGTKVSVYFQMRFGMHRIMDEIGRLFKVFRDNPKTDIDALKKEYENEIS